MPIAILDGLKRPPAEPPPVWTLMLPQLILLQLLPPLEDGWVGAAVISIELENLSFADKSRRKCSEYDTKYEPSVLPMLAAPPPVFHEGEREEREEREGKIILVKSNILVGPVTVPPGTTVCGLLDIRGMAAVFVAEAQYAS
jgi:hypothetical protein